MSQAFTVIATLVAKSGQQAVLKRELSALVQPSREEAGCQYYNLHQDAEAPGTFYVLERWDDEAALEFHNAAPHFQHFLNQTREAIKHFELKRLLLL
ncbi:putative quinol monooxygenase [Pseudomonas chlororaphis]|uniref:putative quinol monooxygenase n=1 Tax=Pseudomonas chlororaphis TaxID=587753 RepID=UPI0023686FF9|nr:putative quinol monooxygenase [Pseudomonas chlororaphis]WDH36111.1 putative quinol monooxygenase [Pseudomonas chlororaphis]WDH42196.1 putative quinol monooxygenase [Pseudomonas chlororaphis]